MSHAEIVARLQERGLTLPTLSVPQGSYVPYVRTGALLFVAGQAPRLDGVLRYAGKVGQDISIEQGQDAARLCALNLLAQAAAACDGDLGRIQRLVRLAGLVNCDRDFTRHPAVIDGASDLFVQVLGERGRHARIATGAYSLPADMAVEIEAIFEVS